MKGRSVTLKLKRRKEGAPEPYKFLGTVLKPVVMTVKMGTQIGV